MTSWINWQARWRSAIQNSRNIFRGPTTTGSRILSTKNSEKFGIASMVERTRRRQAPKQWEWKNAYHSFEHALVGYIVGQQLNDQPITLYYAFSSVEVARSALPYFYSGVIKDIAVNQGQPLQKVTFGNVH